MQLETFSQLLNPDTPTIEFSTTNGQTIMCQQQVDNMKGQLELLQMMIETKDVPTIWFIHRLSNLLDLWRSFMNSDWHRNNQHEPRVGGYSVLRQMLVQKPDPTNTQTLWICGVPNPSRPNWICGQRFRRWDRAIVHIRGRHLNHRPFSCDGSCGAHTWCVIPGPGVLPLTKCHGNVLQ